MPINEQYALDLFRASQHGVSPPPAPGTTRGPSLFRGVLRALRARRASRVRRVRLVRRVRRGTAKPAGCATC